MTVLNNDTLSSYIQNACFFFYLQLFSKGIMEQNIYVPEMPPGGPKYILWNCPIVFEILVYILNLLDEIKDKMSRTVSNFVNRWYRPKLCH